VTTKTEFLARIRRSMPPGQGGVTAARSERPARPAEAAEIMRRQLSERWRDTLERFRAEFEGVGGVFHRVTTAAEVPGLIARLAGEQQAQRVISWHADALGADWSAPLRAAGLTVDPMPPGAIGDEGARPALRRLIADADLGVTGADLAVAETGSLVLISGAGRPRSTSLLPACHVAVFGRTALVESLAQVGVFLEAWHRDAVPAWRGGAINMITGPSRTADIELTLTRGVHGPKELHAVFVDAEASRQDARHG
jgi:L-lactate dehydrogenase complex protein LldG